MFMYTTKVDFTAGEKVRGGQRQRQLVVKILSVPPTPSIVYTHYKFNVDYFLICDPLEKTDHFQLFVKT